jgi:hypothetical protein
MNYNAARAYEEGVEGQYEMGREIMDEEYAYEKLQEKNELSSRIKKNFEELMTRAVGDGNDGLKRFEEQLHLLLNLPDDIVDCCDNGIYEEMKNFKCSDDINEAVEDLQDCNAYYDIYIRRLLQPNLDYVSFDAEVKGTIIEFKNMANANKEAQETDESEVL